MYTHTCITSLLASDPSGSGPSGRCAEAAQVEHGLPYIYMHTYMMINQRTRIRIHAHIHMHNMHVNIRTHIHAHAHAHAHTHTAKSTKLARLQERGALRTAPSRADSEALEAGGRRFCTERAAGAVHSYI